MTSRHKIAYLEATISKLGTAITKLYEFSQQLLASQVGLARVIDLLITKGVLTHDEVKNAIEKVDTERIKEQLSTDGEPANMDANDVGHSGPEQEIHTNEGNGNTESTESLPV